MEYIELEVEEIIIWSRIFEQIEQGDIIHDNRTNSK